jgi:hypothetical protein
VNSEELEVSLRTEFENYINGVRAELKQELSDFQKMVESEVEKHRSQLDDAFRKFSVRLESDNGIDEALKESVVEHLRLARDDGAELAASAAAEAELMGGSHAASFGSFESMRDAIAEISGKTSQSAILKALTDHCSRLSDRGAFFIIKNDNFVGWQVYGNDMDVSATTAKDIHFSVSADTVLAEAVNGLQTVLGSFGAHKDDSKFLKSLKFGSPERMYAIPLVARGRGVAVLYADGGLEGQPVAIDAIEVLVRVAGLTVELLASTPVAKPGSEAMAQDAEPVKEQEYQAQEEMIETEMSASHEGFVSEEFVEESAVEAPIVHEEFPEEVQQVEVSETAGFEAVAEAEPEYVEELTDTVPVVVDESLDDESYLMTDGEHIIEAEAVSSLQEVPASVEVEHASTEFSFASVDTEPAAVVAEEPSHIAEPAVEMNGLSANGRKRPSRVDLPIEVPDEERDKHKKARSFARLLVSEIKLYNPDKVSDGKEANDLYDRLREAIDRSREMYDKRVGAPVSSRFDYFHYELVNGLAEGDESRLGSSYPGAHA